MFRYTNHIVFLFCLLWSHVAYGQTEDHVSVMKRMHIVPNAYMSVTNAAHNDPSGSSGTELLREEYTAVINLVYGRELLTDIENDEWGFRVEYNLEDQGSNIIAQGSNTIQRFPISTIYLDHKRNALSEGYVKLVVTGIYTTDDNWENETSDFLGVVKNIPDDIRLELKIETNRFDYLDPNNPVENLELTKIGDDVLIEWDHLSGAESYQVEFEFQTNHLHPDFSEDPEFENAARIEVRQNNYLLTATYPDGDLFVRVRPIGRHVRNGISSPKVDHHLVLGKWSEPESIRDIDFQPDINWQATTAYAEEGKFKKTVDYFDDALKKRQSATNLSSDSMIIRAATHYDFEGRPVVSVLPAPDLTSNSFAFQNMLDELPPEDFEDPSVTPDIGTANGAGLYYSSSNIGNVGVHTQYVPDAKGFPYTRMQYLNDATGRIKAQSAPGALYQLNGKHDTEYFYDDASDTQLRRLFGRNVGLAKHYKRNIVKDPNGQLSVTYLDIAGNTVATALAGRSPSNVDSLDSEIRYTITENLIENGVVDTSAGISTVTTTLFNEAEDTDYYFCYSLSGINVEQDSTLCLSCRYMLVFEITDPCGNDVALPTDTIIFSGSDLCTDSTYLDSVPCFTLTFDTIGLYTVTKSLSTIPFTMEEWLDELEHLLPDSNYFINQYLAEIDTTECIQSCDQYCRDTLLAQYPMLEGAALEDSILACVYRECLDSTYSEGSFILCDAIHTQMISQLQEGGCLYSTWNETPSALSQLTFIMDGEEVPGIDMHEILIGDLIWEDSWADTLATIHPDYGCCYAFCLSMADSRAFDLKLPFLYSWSDVSSDPTYIVGEDPFFLTGGPGAGLMSSMETAIEEYGTDNGNNPDGCPTPIPLDLVNFIDCILSNSSDAEKWNTYVSLYRGLKQDFVDDVACEGTTTEDCTACMEIPDDFSDISNVDEAIEYANAGIDSLCKDVCMGQAEMIANMIFETCDSTASWQELYDTLYNHCIMVCGYQNPLGYFLEEDEESDSMEDVFGWLTNYNCSVELFDSLIVIPFDSVYVALGYPQNAGIDVVDTICMGDSINLFVLHDSLYIQSLDSLYADSVLGQQEFLLDTGLYYFIGFDSTCCELIDSSCANLDSASFEWFGESSLWAPGDLLGAWPELSGFEDAGCYTFGFYAPSMPGACSEYSEVTIYVPGCDEPELMVDSLGNCLALAYLEYGDHTGPIDTVLWSVSIDGDTDISYTEGDTLSSGMSYVFNAIILYSACCDTLELSDSLQCICEVCEQQFVDICNERIKGFVTMDGDTLTFDAQAPMCNNVDSSALNTIVENLEDFLNGIDSCNMAEVTWEYLPDTCNCWRIIVSESSVIFNYTINYMDNPTYYFDTTGCDSVIILFNPPLDEELATRSPVYASITLYPNPAKGSFYLEFEHEYEIEGHFTVQIANYSGTLLYAEDFLSDGSFDRKLIDVSSIPPGVYKVIVYDARGYYSSTIVLML